MKKLIITAIAATLALTASLTAFATDINDTSEKKSAETQVNFNVTPMYTVTIPDKVKLSETETTDGIKYIGTGTISAEKGLRLIEGNVIEITLSECDYELEAEGSIEYVLPYTVEVDGKSVQEDENHLVATFKTEDNKDVQKSVLTFSADNPEYAGNYSDLVYFTVAVK